MNSSGSRLNTAIFVRVLGFERGVSDLTSEGGRCLTIEQLWCLQQAEAVERKVGKLLLPHGVPCGCGSKLTQQRTAGFSPWFHLPGFHFGYFFLTHSHGILAVGFLLVPPCHPNRRPEFGEAPRSNRRRLTLCLIRLVVLLLACWEGFKTLEAFILLQWVCLKWQFVRTAWRLTS